MVRVYQGTEHQHNRLLEIIFEEDKKRTRINRALDNLAINDKNGIKFLHRLKQASDVFEGNRNKVTAYVWFCQSGSVLNI